MAMRTEGSAIGEAGPQGYPLYKPAAMTIDLEAVAANFAAVRNRVGTERRVIAVLKADAYGHGAAAVAQRLIRAGADLLAIGSLEDAAALRAAGVAAPLMLLSSLQPEMIDDVLALDLIPAVDDAGVVLTLAAAARRPTAVFVKVDAGFGRLGVPLAAAARFVRDVAAQQRLRAMGVYTHLPFSDPAGRDWALQRHAAFIEMVESLAQDGIRPEVTQALASAGTYLGLSDRLNAVAVGSMLFGIRPVAGMPDPAGWALRPALTTVKTRLVHVGLPPPGDEGALYLRGRSGPVGVIPVGIHHGYRPVSSDAFVIIGGTVAPVLRACLENTVIDLAAAPGTTAGTEAIVLGTVGDLRIGIDQIAAWQGTSVLATLSGLGRSLPRHYGGDGAPAGDHAR